MYITFLNIPVKFFYSARTIKTATLSKVVTEAAVVYAVEQN